MDGISRRVVLILMGSFLWSRANDSLRWTMLRKNIRAVFLWSDGATSSPEIFSSSTGSPHAGLQAHAVEEQGAVTDAEGRLAFLLQHGRQGLEQELTLLLEGVVVGVVDLGELVDDMEADEEVDAGFLEGLGLGPPRRGRPPP